MKTCFQLLRSKLARLLTLTLLGLPACAATYTWKGGSGSWSDPMKWSSQQVPGAGDTAIISGTDALTIAVTGSRSVGTLVMENRNATMRVVETIGGSMASLTVANGFENHGVIELNSEVGSGNIVTLAVTSGTLTNAVGGVLRAATSGGRSAVEANLDNRGTVEAAVGLLLRGNVANSGTVHIPEGQTLSFHFPTIWTHQGGAITGTGTLQFEALNGSRLELESDFTPGAYVLEGRGLTVNGPGKLFGPPTGELRMHQWTINADVVVTGGIRVEGGTAVNGALSILPGNTLRVVETIGGSMASLTVANGFENHGVIELNSEVGSGNIVTLAVTSGTLTNAVGGVLRAATSGGRSAVEANLDNRGTVEAAVGLLLRGNVANSGTVHIPEGQTLSFHFPTIWTHQGGAITGTGTLQFEALNGSRLELESDFTPGAYVLEGRGLTVNGPGRLLGPPSGEFLIQDWTINAGVIVSGDLRIERVATFNGVLTVAPGKTLRVVETAASSAELTVANGFENEGTIELTSEASSGRSAILTVTAGTLTNATGGVIRVLAGAGGNRQILANLDNRGTLEVEKNTSLFLNGTLLNAPSGILGGNGTFDLTSASISNDGILAPGASPGILTLSGSLQQRTLSRLDIEIGGFVVGSEHDQLVLDRPVLLDGSIRVILTNGFFPKKDDAFAVLTYPSRTGAFAVLDNPLPERIAWEVRYEQTVARLVVLNTAPTLAAITHRTVNEQVALSVVAIATDQDLPAQTLTYSLDTAPDGMTIHPSTGAISWTPTEAQGPGMFNVTVRVTDNGMPALAQTTRFTVTVNEVNVPPQLVLPGVQSVDEQTEIAFTIQGTDADRPTNALTFEMVSGPAGASFNPSTREFRWTPTEAQGPGNFTAAFRVTDNNPEAVNEKQMSATGQVGITVRERNLNPVLAAIANQTAAEEVPFSVTVMATDPDLPANLLVYSLDAAPAGMTIHPSTGAILWTPTEAQGPGTFEVLVRVTDNGVPELAQIRAFSVSVGEVNRQPLLNAVANTTVHAGAAFAISLGATDPDVPANAVTFSLVNGPVGATVSASGRVEWTTPLTSSGSTGAFVVRVTDDGVPPQSDEKSFRVAVAGPLEILGSTRSGDQWTILWHAIPGTTYRLVSATTLPATEWSPVPGEVTSTGNTASQTIVLTPDVSASFLRVELVR